MALTAPVLSVNSFNNPKVLEDKNAMYMQIIYLILLKKGTFQTRPDMGVSLRERYRYNNSETLRSDLLNDIQKQMEQYLPELQDAKVDVEIDNVNHIMTIIVDTTEATYGLQYNTVTDQVTTQDNQIISFIDLY